MKRVRLGMWIGFVTVILLTPLGLLARAMWATAGTASPSCEEASTRARYAKLAHMDATRRYADCVVDDDVFACDLVSVDEVAYAAEASARATERAVRRCERRS